MSPPDRRQASRKGPLNFSAGFFSFKSYHLLKLFNKSIALTLVLTFSWWQLVWAIDVRKLLWDQDQSFQEQEMRRGEGINAQELELAQSRVESEIESQESLQELQNQNFSLTTENGILLEQINQDLIAAQSPDGSVLTTIQMDADGNVIVADLQLSDGSIQVYQNGQLIGYVAPDGTQVLYENGEVQKVIFPDGTEAAFSFIQGGSQGILLENGTTLIFEGGAFSHLLDPVGNKHYYDANGKPKKIVLNSGWTLDGIILSADGQSILDFSVYDPQGNLVSGQGGVTHPDLIPQTLYSYENFRSQAEQTGWIQITQDGITSTYDSGGRLVSLKLLDLTIFYKPDGAIDYVHKADGTELYDLVFDENGVIKDALVISS
ncbi:MAG: hypothetical protein ACREH5_02750, partial [Candidatus Omnitrophota bacterium]